jgi:hypothetical protein
MQGATAGRSGSLAAALDWDALIGFPLPLHATAALILRSRQ